MGDLRDAASISKALSGCDVVFHVAADYRLWVRDPDEMYRSNVEGTRSLLEAARKQGVRRVVYTSSVATMGFTSNHAAAELRSAWTLRLRSGQAREGARPHTTTVADEESPVSLADMIGHYKRSKFMAEQVAVEAARSGVDVVIVNPTTPVGERDIKPTPTGRIVLDFLKRKFPAYVETGLNLVDATECARGHVQALEKGRSGERYILGGENLNAEADFGPAGCDHGFEVADVETALRVRVRGRSRGRDGDGPVAGPRTPRDDRRRAHGAQDDVCEFSESGTGTGLADGSSRWRLAPVGGLVPGQRVCLGSPS